MNRLTWHGHATFSLQTSSGHRLFLDPWLDDNPLSDIKSKKIESLDFILVSHGHDDHFADAIKLCKQTNATLPGAFELVAFAESKGVLNGKVDVALPRVVIPMHYSTFEVIRQDPYGFARRVGARAEVRVLAPGQSYDF